VAVEVNLDSDLDTAYENMSLGEVLAAPVSAASAPRATKPPLARSPNT
jgi:hypothetical protein